MMTITNSKSMPALAKLIVPLLKLNCTGTMCKICKSFIIALANDKFDGKSFTKGALAGYRTKFFIQPTKLSNPKKIKENSVKTTEPVTT